MAHAADNTRQNYQPFASRDQNLFNLVHGQPLPVNAQLLKADTAQVTTTLAITNTVNLESANGESLILDYESYVFRLLYQHGLGQGWNLRLDIPLVYQGGGIFDSAIDNWHDFFGLSQGFRPAVEHNQYDIRYSNSQTTIHLDNPDTSIGDIQLALGKQLHTHRDSSLGLWGSIKAATGNPDTLSGSGNTDFAFWLAWNRRTGENFFVNLNAGLVFPGGSEFRNMKLADQVMFGSAMLNWRPLNKLHLKLQLHAHSSYYQDSALQILGDTYLLSFGGTVLFDCSSLDISMNEDIKVDASPDVSLIISWRKPLDYNNPANRNNCRS